MRKSLLTAAILMASTSAFAQTVDQPGAEALTATLKRYIGQTIFDKKVLGVTPDGDAYKLTLDVDAAMKAWPSKDETMTVSPMQYSLRLKPQAGGAWGVSFALDSAGSVESKSAGKPASGKWSTSGNRGEGVFDPAIGYFSSASGVYGPMELAIDEQSDGAKTSTAVRISSGTYTVTGKAGANGGTDLNTSAQMNDFVETIEAKGGEVSVDPVAIRSPKVELASAGVAVRTAELLDLLAFGVANSDKEKITAAQPELKAKLVAALPLWQSIRSGYSFHDIEVVAQQGTFGAAKAGVDFTMDGITASSAFSYGVTLSGPKYPAGLAPVWMTDILPTDLAVHVGGKNLNLDAPMRKFIAAMDVSKDPPVSEVVSAEIYEEFMAANPVFTVTDTSVSNRDTAFTIEAELTYPQWRSGDMTKVAGTMTVEASGFEKLEDKLKEAAAIDQQAAQAFPAVLAAKGFAKTLPDGKLQWVVDASPDGSVRINGTMIKGPDSIGGGDSDDIADDAEPVDPDAPAPGLTNPNP